MDMQSIGENAGIVWRLLNDGKRWEYDDVRKASGLSERELSAAVGWLAREGKICFETDTEHHKDFLFLSLNIYY